MESISEEGRMRCSKLSAKLLMTQVHMRGETPIKGKGKGDEFAGMRRIIAVSIVLLRFDPVSACRLGASSMVSGTATIVKLTEQN